MNGNFISDGTRAVVLGPCLCPGTPHDEDTAQVLEEVPWDVLVDVELATGGEATRRLVAGTLAAWNLVDEDGDPVPVDGFAERRRRPPEDGPEEGVRGKLQHQGFDEGGREEVVRCRGRRGWRRRRSPPQG